MRSGGRVSGQLDTYDQEQATEASGERALAPSSQRPGVAYRCRSDPHRTMEYVSEGILELTGYRPADFVAGRVHWADLVCPECLMTDIARRAQPGHWFQVEYRVRRKHGAECRVLDQCQGIFDTSNRLIAFEGFLSDLTDHREYWQDIATASRRLNAHIDNSPLAVIEFDAAMRIQRWSRGAERLFGWNATEVLGCSIADLSWVHDEDAESVREISAAMLAGQCPRSLNVNRNYRKDGCVIHCEWHNSAIYDSRGRLHSILSQVLDITARKLSEQALAESEAHWHQLAESMPNLVWTCAPNGDCDYLSRQWLAYTGRSEAEQLGSGWLEQVHPEDRERLRETWPRALQFGDPIDVECRVRRYDGCWHWFKSCARPIRDDTGRVIKWYGSSTDIEELKRSEVALREASDTREAILQSMTEALMIADPSGQVVALNPAALRLYGFAGEADACRQLNECPGLFDARDLAGHEQPLEAWPLARALRGEVFTQQELCIRRCDTGQTFIGSYSGTPVRSADGVIRYGITTVRDITEQKRAEERIKHLAHYDILTQLPNRRLLQERLGMSLARAKRHGSSLAVMVLDLDHFKQINDSLGHTVGDVLLCEAARRMLECLRECDTAARTGGDEFVLLLPDTDAEGAAHFAHRLVDHLATPLQIDDHTLTISCSLGISLYPDNGQKEYELIERADMALYRSKQQGRSHFRFFNEEMHQDAVSALTLKQQLRQALTRDELFLLYQPQMDLETNRPIGVEALLRWTHPTRGLLKPIDFLSLAEESELIQDLGSWVLHTVATQIKAWQRIGLQPLPVAVNVSALQLRHSQRRRALCELITELLQETGVSPRLLELEITEESLMEETEATLATLRRLCELGLRLTIDDFGSGYSNLNYLKFFPLDRLKIEQSFIRDIVRSRKDEAIVDTILALGRNLGFEVIAEGVETEAQLHKIREKGCRQAQGYFFSHPLPPNELCDWLRDAV
jgi:diguanylate cyclase (GGDEF)-like protein/PAS domain S-box-containing protein